MRKALKTGQDDLEDTRMVAQGVKVSRSGRDFAYLKQRTKEKIDALRATLGKTLGRLAAFAGENFPFELKKREQLLGMPPLAKSWHKLLAFVLAGSIAWAGLVAFSHRRSPWFSIVVAIIVAVGIVYSLGARFGLSVAACTSSLAVLSLVMGELIVQLLYVSHVIPRLDVTPLYSVVSVEKPEIFYRVFFNNLLVWRIIPSAVIAFFIGWWPIKRRPGWRGLTDKTR